MTQQEKQTKLENCYRFLQPFYKREKDGKKIYETAGVEYILHNLVECGAGYSRSPIPPVKVGSVHSGSWSLHVTYPDWFTTQFTTVIRDGKNLGVSNIEDLLNSWRINQVPGRLEDTYRFFEKPKEKDLLILSNSGYHYKVTEVSEARLYENPRNFFEISIWKKQDGRNSEKIDWSKVKESDFIKEKWKKDINCGVTSEIIDLKEKAKHILDYWFNSPDNFTDEQIIDGIGNILFDVFEAGENLRLSQEVLDSRIKDKVENAVRKTFHYSIGENPVSESINVVSSPEIVNGQEPVKRYFLIGYNGNKKFGGFVTGRCYSISNKYVDIKSIEKQLSDSNSLTSCCITFITELSSQDFKDSGL